ncbi:MAG: hypothetical protein FJX71_01750 [Alphaproteobacteria bacterium]|nr:hypothetical protein [Alphaproteobacteria bacterium]
MDKRCTPLDWTSDRFGQKVIKSYHQALDTLKKNWGIQSVTLHGYSGGATVCLLVAAQRKDVISVVTFAPLLDISAWSSYHGYTQLNGSLTPLDFTLQLTHITQHHFIGLEDEAVPLKLSEAYFAAFPSTCSITVHKIPFFSHQSDWPKFWKSSIINQHEHLYSHKTGNKILYAK